MAILLAILFLPLLAVDLCTASIVSPPAPKEDLSIVGSLAGFLVESCGRCHLRLPGGHSAELFTFEDGPEQRFLFVQNDGFLHILDRKRSGELATELKKFEEVETRRNGAEIRLKTIAAAKKKPPTAADRRKPNEKGPSYRRQDRRQIASSGKYPPVACQLQKLRPVPTAALYRSKYASARLAHVGFVPANPDQWWNGEQQLNIQHKWWWYFALRLDNAKCLLARLPTGAARINLDLGVRLVENARALHVCPLLAFTNGNEQQQQQQQQQQQAEEAEQAEFGCVEPHVFLLGNQQQDGNGSSVPMELGFSYQVHGKEGVNGRLRVNPFEMRNSTGGGKKNVRILLGHKFGGSEDFVEFAPYCDYGHSFVHVQPAAAAMALSSQNNGTDESNNIIDITYKNNKNRNKNSRNGNQPVAHATIVPNVPAAGDSASGHIASLENVKTMESDRATLDQLRQSFFNIKTGLKGVKGVIERFRQAIVRGR